MAEMSTVVFADGAAKGNPGPGGWGAIVVTPDGQVTELGGGARHTTNNRMELTAAIEALQHVGAAGGAGCAPPDTPPPLPRAPGGGPRGRRGRGGGGGGGGGGGAPRPRCAP